MLKSLNIKNFAIIDDLEVEFSHGLSVLTGETGAGKSIIVDALALLLGERAQFEQIRFGADRAFIEGCFLIENPFTQQIISASYPEIASDDKTVIVRRMLDKNGRTTYKINGMNFTLNEGKKLLSTLVDIHSQNEFIALLDKKRHQQLLDAWLDNNQVKKNFNKAYQEYLRHKEQRLAYEKTQISAEQADFIAFQIEEIINARLEVGELAVLLQKQKDLQNRAKLIEKRATIEQLLQADHGAVNQLYLASKEIISVDQDNWQEKIKNLYFETRAIADEIDQKLKALTESDFSLEEISNRIYQIKKIVHKHGGDEASALEALIFMQKQFDDYRDFQPRLTKLVEQEETRKTFALEKAKLLSQYRQEVAKKLAFEVDQHLRDLALKNAHFQVHFERSGLTSEGYDEIEFYLSANLGSPYLPLKTAISGGEASRLMLALKLVFTSGSGLETLIFDEVDSGVSGRVADQVGKKIKKLAQTTQVIAITHLPQVASYADTHYYVEKHVRDNKTVADIRLLHSHEIIEAIARLIAGNKVTPASLQAAAELLKSAN
ncbi:MAG: DNA repair protein RecN [Bacilli bacterium]